MAKRSPTQYAKNSTVSNRSTATLSGGIGRRSCRKRTRNGPRWACSPTVTTRTARRTASRLAGSPWPTISDPLPPGSGLRGAAAELNAALEVPEAGPSRGVAVRGGQSNPRFTPQHNPPPPYHPHPPRSQAPLGVWLFHPFSAPFCTNPRLN